MQMQTKFASLKTDGERTFTGKLAVYDNEDVNGDFIEVGTFAEQDGEVVPFYAEHNSNAVIGSLTLRAEDDAIWVDGEFDNTPLADKYYKLALNGNMTHLSVGFTTDGNYIEEDGVRKVDHGTIVEGSLVGVPANGQAEITEIKSANLENTNAEFSDKMKPYNVKENINMARETKSIENRTVNVQIDTDKLVDAITERLQNSLNFEAGMQATIENGSDASTGDTQSAASDASSAAGDTSSAASDASSAASVASSAAESSAASDATQPATETKSLLELQAEYTGSANNMAKETPYIETKSAMDDLMTILQENGNDREAWTKAWNAKLLETKSVTDTGHVLLPSGIVQTIEDAVRDSGEMLTTFDMTGLVSLPIAINNNGIDTENGRAKGHKGSGTKKSEQEIVLEKKQVVGQYIYKYLTVPKEMLRENENGALLNYIYKELPQRVIEEVKRAAIIGDGRVDGSDDKITSFEPMVSASASFISTVEATTSLYEDIINGLGTIVPSDKKYLVMNSQTVAKLKLAKDASGQYLFAAGSDLATMLGVDGIFTADWMPLPTDASANIVVGYAQNAYKMVGDNVLDADENFVLAENKMEYLQELYAGGALGKPKSAFKIVTAAG